VVSLNSYHVGDLQSQLAEHYCIRSHAPCRVIKTSSLLSVD
jgi:hypothetical protein